MSLFGNLFGAEGGTSGLFSEGSKFKAHHHSEQPTQTAAEPLEVEASTKKSKKDKHAAKAAGADKQPNAAADAAALKLQAGIAAAKAAQDAEDALQGLTECGKRRKRDKHDTSSRKAHKSVADASPAAASQQPTQSQEQQPQHNAQHKQKTQRKHIADTAQPEQQQGAAPAEAPQQEDSDTPNAATDAADANAAQTSKLTPEQEAEKLSRTIFVGNLPVTIKRKQLTRIFSSYGDVESVRLRSVPLDLESKKKLPRKAAVIKGVVSSDRGGTNAYVVFKEQAAAMAALAANMTEVDGHHIRVDRATPPSGAAADGAAAAGGGGSHVLYDPVRSVFVGNLDFKITEEELISAFSAGDSQPELTAAVEAVRVIRDPKTNIGKGIAYVLFKTKAAARAALQLDGQQIGKRAMRVSRVDRKASAAAAPGKQRGDGPGAAGGAKRFKDKHIKGQGLGVQQGGLQKRFGVGKPSGRSSAATADWQGLRTKGKGAGFRSGGKASKPSGSKGSKPQGSFSPQGGSKGAGFSPKGRAGGFSPKGKGGKPGGSIKASGKRPAVAARKEKAKAAAKRTKAGKQ